MSARRDSSDGPEDIDAAFAEIVADLERDETFARWSAEAKSGTAEDETAEPEPPKAEAKPEPAAEPAAETGTGPRDWTPGEEDEEHFVPPEPPPLPIPKPGALAGIGVVVLGLVVLLIPGLAGLPTTAQLPLGLVLISAGIGWLLFRLRRAPPTDPTDPDDDGAQV
ncbi:DUF308 domain-containing protein [Saccharopolyspora griseoalba]|uniref:DUF308 domain-containing protein n=1 Tax=Saccharopolyspora griseoalba TaxID=1431848 RepID=A0ABW2LR18_9PSEU